MGNGSVHTAQLLKFMFIDSSINLSLKTEEQQNKFVFSCRIWHIFERGWNNFAPPPKLNPVYAPEILNINCVLFMTYEEQRR